MIRTPDKDRVAKSRDKLREQGGVVTTVRLSPEAAKAAQALIDGGYAKDRRHAIDRALQEAAAKLKP